MTIISGCRSLVGHSQFNHRMIGSRISGGLSRLILLTLAIPQRRKAGIPLFSAGPIKNPGFLQETGIIQHPFLMMMMVAFAWPAMPSVRYHTSAQYRTQQSHTTNQSDQFHNFLLIV
jgi:hypothetical protein